MMISYLLAFSLATGAVSGSSSIDNSEQKTVPATPRIRTIDIVGTDEMSFSVTQITARPGERLRIRLRSDGAMRKAVMAHNVVVLRKGVESASFNAAALMSRATDFVPPSRQADVIAATRLAGAGETVEVVFTVPSVRGDYEFICTFPGHYAAGMRGILTVR